MTQPAQDTWGSFSIPAQPTYAPFSPVAVDLWVSPADIPLADPCLAVILDYLATAINTDQIIQAAWDPVKSLAAQKPLNRIFPHDPGEVVFSASHIPALYMWRESGATAYAADDWYRRTDLVKALWVYPLGTQNNQRVRQPFVNALIDGIINAIERGRTPSWLQPSDTTDTRSPAEGSVFYPYAGFESFFLTSWKKSKLVVGADAAPYPAIEMTFTMEENQVYGLTRFFVNTTGANGAQLALYDASGTTAWSAFTSYTTAARVAPTHGTGKGFIFACTVAGMSANVQPRFPALIGATVVDGGVTWTCLSTMAPNGNLTVSGPFAP